MKASLVLKSTLGLALLAGCTSSGSVRSALKKNPDILYEVIEENPEKFLEVLNRAAEKAQAQLEARRRAEVQARQQDDLKNPRKPKLEVGRRLAGSDSGKIVVVEYADFQCPACSMAHASLKEFQRRRPGQVQFYYKNMPLSFHPQALPAARYFEAIKLQGNALAQKFYDEVFSKQRELGNDGFFEAVARRAGADLKRLRADLKSERIDSLIQEDMAEFEAFGFTGTPVVIVNGVALEGAPSVEALERAVALTEKR
jgi:protein-disulfide isomerase